MHLGPRAGGTTARPLAGWWRKPYVRQLWRVVPN